VPLIPYLAAEHVGLGTETVAAFRAVEPASLAAAPDGGAGAGAVPHLPLAPAGEAHA